MYIRIRVVIGQDEYENKYNQLARKYEEINSRVEEVEKKIFNQKVKFENIDIFIEKLKECDKLITDFEEGIFNTIIDKIIVNKNEVIKIKFKDSSVLEIDINNYQNREKIFNGIPDEIQH